jgi:hypothetical protein
MLDLFLKLWYNQKCADKKEDSLMEITVYGKVSDSLEKKLISAANFYAKILLGEKLAKQIRLDIEVEPILEENNQGECFPEDENKNPRYFTIKLAKKKNEMLISKYETTTQNENLTNYMQAVSSPPAYKTV